jgi:outer membrane protein TolC
VTIRSVGTAAVGLLVIVIGFPAQAGRDALRIEDAVARALARNERARIADLNVTVAAAGVDKARAAFLPTVNVGGIYTQKPDDVVAPPKSSYTAVASVTISQPLINASAFPLYAEAKRLLDGQVAQTQDDKRVLAFDAARAFFTALSADAVVTAASTRLDTAKANLADTEARVQAQLVSTNDVTRATIDLANAVHELENDRGTARIAYVALAYTINSPVPNTLVTPTALLAAGRAAVPPVDGLVRLAILRRPDLASKRQVALAAHDFAAEPLLRLVPTLGVSGTLQLSSDETIVGHGFYNTEALVATLSWPLFDAGVRYADKRSRDAAAESADLVTAELVRSVDEQVRSSAIALEASQKALVAAAQARDAAKKSADETAILYKQGLAKAIELVDANDQRFLAEVSYATAEYAVAIAYLSLRQSVGLDPIGTELR